MTPTKQDYVTEDICRLKHKEVDEMKRKIDYIFYMVFGILTSVTTGVVLLYLRGVG